MKTLDRILLIVLVVGVWGVVGTVWFKPSNVDAQYHTHDVYDVFGAAEEGHTHDSYDVLGVAKEGHTHDYAKKSHSHSYAEAGHSHETGDIEGFSGRVRGILSSCYIDGGNIYC